MIMPVGELDIRAGVRAGISSGAPALTVNFWISRTFFRSSSRVVSPPRVSNTGG